MAVKADSIEEATYLVEQAAENKRLKEENDRLRAIISEPVESFGAPELVVWSDRLQCILAEYPEEDRGSWAFILTTGEHLEKFAKAWNSPTIAAKEARIAELEDALRAFLDSISQKNMQYGLATVDPAEFKKARAALPQTGSQAAPSDGLPPNACRCARCEAKRHPGERQYDDDMDRWIVFDGEKLRLVEDAPEEGEHDERDS